MTGNVMNGFGPFSIHRKIAVDFAVPRMVSPLLQPEKDMLPTGEHWHQCPRCHALWHHPDTMAGNEEAHACPNCKTLTFFNFVKVNPPIAVQREALQKEKAA